MKIKTLITLLAIFFTSCFAISQNIELNKLVYKKQFLKLAAIMEKENNLSDEDVLFYNALFKNALGKSNESRKMIDEIKNRHLIENYPDSLQFYLYMAEYSNYVRLFDYEKAYNTYHILMKKFANYFNEEEMEGEAQSAKIWECLKKYPPQTTEKTNDTRLPITMDIAGLANIPVSINDTTCKFLFDTGAGVSTISESFAKKLKLQIIPNAKVSIKGGITGISTDVYLAIAPNLNIGNIKIKNAVFLVFPDKAMSFAEGRYVINGVIGFPIMMTFEEFSISNGFINIPKQISDALYSPNMTLDFLKPIIYMGYKNQCLPFTFDTGANTSTFNDIFYVMDKSYFDGVGRIEEINIGGAGGDKKQIQLFIPELRITVSNKSIIIKDAEISKVKISTNGYYYYGNIGQDVIKQFAKMTISFANSYINFE